MPIAKRTASGFNLPHEKHHYKILILVGLVGLWLILELLGYGVFNRASQNKTVDPPPLSASKTKSFTASSVMGGFTIEIPEGFEVEEKFGTVIIRNQTKQIRISQNSTNFNNLNDYVTSLEELNKINFKEESSIQINNLPIKLGYIENQKTYFILFQYTVYSLSTEDASQYSILDQIAHSFRIQNNK
ncbi:TPA: hypothetical protein DIV55_01225 [Patescibacteria group bacterium]|uniref:Uncharacterized protein n=1 Tax=Candidatus Gottesmanbacteria bacterium GW2011_GWA1_43_11 TaxID=1618436 RepID=A0A0G1FAQ6_9BACT|nr:MAG: hypothetical protein UV59_C0029G0015 [Candidatus Gottesmanbacteria bacterium GW2011_GWA1_43_11]HCS78344.1 hypothetical protein [Patescibacteria group bacterium]